MQEVFRFSERMRWWGWLQRWAEPTPAPTAIGSQDGDAGWTWPSGDGGKLGRDRFGAPHF